MEMQQHEEISTTTNYWGYRELSANEIDVVSGGGDFSGDGFGGHTGYGSSSYTSYASSQPSNSNGISNAQALALAQILQYGAGGGRYGPGPISAFLNFMFPGNVPGGSD
jgi:hypothetical protein